MAPHSCANPDPLMEGSCAGGEASGAAACLARVTLQFQQRPEWVQRGQTLLLRDRTDGCLAAAGLIVAVSTESSEHPGVKLRQ